MKKRPLPPGAKLHSQSKEAAKVFSGTRFDVYQWPQKLFDGSIETFEIVKRNDTVIVIPVIGDEIAIVKEVQPHWEKPGHTLVAGMVNPEEDLGVAARRELEEETGLIFENYHLVHILEPVPAVEWFAYTFIASGHQGQKEKKLDPGEQNEVVRISFDRLIEMTRRQEFLYRPKFVEDILLQEKAGKLQEILKNPSKYKIAI